MCWLFRKKKKRAKVVEELIQKKKEKRREREKEKSQELKRKIDEEANRIIESLREDPLQTYVTPFEDAAARLKDMGFSVEKTTRYNEGGDGRLLWCVSVPNI